MALGFEPLSGSSGVVAFVLSPEVASSRVASAAAAPQHRLRASAALSSGAGAAPSALGSQWSQICFLAAGAIAGTLATKSFRRITRRAANQSAGGRHSASARDEEAHSRAQLLRGIVGTCTAPAAASLVAPTPAGAKTYEEAQAALATYGLPDLAPARPPQFAWKVIVEPIGLASDAYYGRFKMGGEQQIVTFSIPPLWVVTKPNIDFNGAAGTVQANDYGKGDSATLFVDTEFKGKLADMKKPDFLNALKKALSTKGKNFVEGLKITKVSEGAPGYRLIEYEYELESAAGFQIGRDGIAAVSQVGEAGNLQIFWTGVVSTRVKSMESTLKDIVNSFRMGSVPRGVSIEKRSYKRDDEAR